MGWQINCMYNDLTISEDCAIELFEKQTDSTWWELEDVRENDGTITFNDDHMEGMDYLYDAEIRKILLKHKVNGEVHFNCADGDQAGQAWGHRFVNGQYTELIGIITFIPKKTGA